MYNLYTTSAVRDICGAICHVNYTQLLCLSLKSDQGSHNNIDKLTKYKYTTYIDGKIYLFYKGTFTNFQTILFKLQN